MPILPIRHFPDAILKAPSRRIEHVTPEIRRLIDDMVQTMRHHRRCVGLAAPQVGAPCAVAVMDVAGHPKAEGAGGLQVLINPEVLAEEGSVMQREGCLSIPDLTGNARRARRVQIKAQDASGVTWVQWFEGFEAIAAQHEVDHLNGTLFLDRVENVRTGVFRRKNY